jgi:large subunit ribosomal protein L24
MQMHATTRVKNPGKQRKRLFNAPAHLRHKHMSAPTSPEILAQKGLKSIPVRKGDTVRVMRGDHKGFEGKISRIDLKDYRVYLEGLNREKVDGTTVFVGIHPSKLMIKTLNLDDKLRKAIVDRKKPLIKKKAAKPAKETAVPKKVAKAAKPEKETLAEPAEEMKLELEKPAEAIEAKVEEAAVPEETPEVTAEPAKKPASKKKKAEPEATEEKPAETKPAAKEAKPRAVKKTAETEEASKTAKKPAAKLKTASKTEGGA